MLGILYNLPYWDKPLLKLNPIILSAGYNNLHIKDLQKFLYKRKWVLGKATELAQDLPVIRGQIQDLSLGTCSYKAPNTFHFASLYMKDRCPELVLGLKNNLYAFYMYNLSFDRHRTANVVDVFSLFFMWSTWSPNFQGGGVSMGQLVCLTLLAFSRSKQCYTVMPKRKMHSTFVARW